LGVEEDTELWSKLKKKIQKKTIFEYHRSSSSQLFAFIARLLSRP